ncbi:aspartic peptidase domain-containing protein [Suillus clintonianus]|uniref:aspartic peptidase domain-containing protein n=1 Tax=Suillus clintonianus TaxID=1904413 RepID=UPI001B87C2DB|nr:aspartic peptidase domain-containing protein [Suillus clintonianus]KAG2130898.1 aspartic peptidase domain-containing protein [Suillus clintonianus]
MLLSSLLFVSLLYSAWATDSTWASIPMNVPSQLTNLNFNYATVTTYFGTPPQQMNLTIDVSTGEMAAYSVDCVFCSGETFFDASLSSTFQHLNSPWAQARPDFNGSESSDTMSFGGILTVTDAQFVLIDTGSYSLARQTMHNGFLGAFLNPLNSTIVTDNIFSQLYQSKQLLNPVIGMRFDPRSPKLTVGALDANDYEGTINWVQLESNPSWDAFNTFQVDGLKGYNGSFVPQGSGGLFASIDSLLPSIAVQNVSTYATNNGYIGPAGAAVTIDKQTNVASLLCDETYPYIPLTVSINGVDYQVDSSNNLLYSRQIQLGLCTLGMTNRSDTLPPNFILGQPFLRSVYVAYRFPTDNCPGYYGFAFAKGANRTQAQISQTPTSTPTNSAQCLSFASPTSTPSATIVTARQALLSSEKYSVYGSTNASQVPLIDVENLSKMTWNATNLY